MTYLDMKTRIAGELRRTNLDAAIRGAINDAIAEAANTRFYFNEVLGQTFNTVIGQEYYSDLNMVEIDAIYYFVGPTRRNMYEDSNLLANERADGNAISGQLSNYSRYGMQLRLYPIPNAVTAIYLDGFGKLTPWPVINDADTNNWFTEGERYIRALAKRNVLRDTIRDFSEAAVCDAIAEDYKTELLDASTVRRTTGVLRATQW